MEIMEAKKRYIDLMKKALSFTLWTEPPLPIEAYSYKRSALKKAWFSLLTGIFDLFHIRLMKDNRFSQEDITDGKVWPGYADTMIGLKRLDNLQYCVETALNDKVPGDLIETGVWRGGACIFMRAILAAYEDNERKVYVADSFAGLPEPDAEKYPQDSGDKHFIEDYLAVSQEEVANNFKRYDLLDEQVVFLKGWFKDTLPSASFTELAVIRLDGDMYESTMDALKVLYPKLSSGGFCIIDDYALKGCRQAVEDYRQEHGINEEIMKIDWSGCYWRKA